MTSRYAQRSHAARPAAALFSAWLARAVPGARLEYHQGFLTEDRSPASGLAEDERREVTKLADIVLKAAQRGRVHLLQRRNGPADFTYFANKAGSSAQPAEPPAENAASITDPDLRLRSTG